MLKSKEQVANRVRTLCLRHITRLEVQENTQKLKDKYGIPNKTANDVLTLRADLETQTDFVLFCVFSILEERELKVYFTESEIETYSKARFEEDHISFPLKFKAIQVTDEQWIGTIDIKTLMALRDAQLLNYNENTQRSLQRVIKGGIEYYKISINKQAVEKIEDLINSGQYIPNTITLNMPEDTDYYYRETELVIREISQFDLLDGYHRYIALSRLYNLNPSLNYTMELRLVCFPEGKAKQFIYQEDQKTKMRKLDSDSFNQNLEANKIVERLNADTTFILAGYITRNEGVINAPQMAQLIDLLWYGRYINKKDAIKKSLEVRKILKDGLDAVIEQDPSLTEKEWDYKFLCCVMGCIYKGTTDISKIRELYKGVEVFNPSKMNRKILNRILAKI